MSGKRASCKRCGSKKWTPRRGLFAYLYRLAAAAQLLGLSPSKRFRS